MEITVDVRRNPYIKVYRKNYKNVVIPDILNNLVVIEMLYNKSVGEVFNILNSSYKQFGRCQLSLL